MIARLWVYSRPPQRNYLAAFGRKLFTQTLEQIASILIAARDEANARRVRDGCRQKVGFADASSFSPGHLFNRSANALRNDQPCLVAVRPRGDRLAILRQSLKPADRQSLPFHWAHDHRDNASVAGFMA